MIQKQGNWVPYELKPKMLKGLRFLLEKQRQKKMYAIKSH